MPTFDDNTRTPKTTKKRPAATTGGTPVRKRATKAAAAEKPAGAPSKDARSAPAVPTPTAPSAPALKIVPVPAPPTPSASAAAPRPVAVVTGARPDPVIATVVDADERRRMVAEAAYHKFLERGPGNGSPAQDWWEAEAEIDALLAEQQIVRAQ